MTFANLFPAGREPLTCRCPMPALATNLKTGSLSFKEFIVHVFPKKLLRGHGVETRSCRSWCSSLFFGIAVTALKEKTAKDGLSAFIDEVAHADAEGHGVM